MEVGGEAVGAMQAYLRLKRYILPSGIAREALQAALPFLPSAARELALEEAAVMLEAKAEAANSRAVAFTEKLSGPLKGRKKSEQWRSEKAHNERIKFYYQKAATAIRALSSPDHADAGKVEGAGLREDVAKVYAWLREPDWNEEWDFRGWLNRRPSPNSFALIHEQWERSALPSAPSQEVAG